MAFLNVISNLGGSRDFYFDKFQMDYPVVLKAIMQRWFTPNRCLTLNHFQAPASKRKHNRHIIFCLRGKIIVFMYDFQ